MCFSVDEQLQGLFYYINGDILAIEVASKKIV